MREERLICFCFITYMYKKYMYHKPRWSIFGHSGHTVSKQIINFPLQTLQIMLWVFVREEGAIKFWAAAEVCRAAAERNPKMLPELLLLSTPTQFRLCITGNIYTANRSHWLTCLMQSIVLWMLPNSLCFCFPTCHKPRSFFASQGRGNNIQLICQQYIIHYLKLVLKN